MGFITENILESPFLQPEPVPLPPIDSIEVATPLDTILEEQQDRFRSGESYLSAAASRGFVSKFMLDGVPIKTPKIEYLSTMDYIGDASQELLAGIVEGATLENVQFGDLGPDTSVGDIARTVGSFGGSLIPYTGIAMLLGHLGVFAGPLSLPLVMARAGATAFTARALRDIDDDEEDLVDRLQSSLIHGTIGAGISAIPAIFDKALMEMHGGPVKYMETLKKRLSTQLVKRFGFTEHQAIQAGREFEAEVVKQGGAKSLNGAMLKRIAKGETNAKTFLKMQRGVHAIAKGKRGLGLNEEEFYRINISRTGEAHTNRMGINELRGLRTFYADMLKNRARQLSGTDDFMQVAKTSTGFEPGFFSFNRPVERVMRQMGFQDMYERVYDAKIISINEQQGFDMVRRQLIKGIRKGDRKAIFKMMDTVQVPMVDVATGKPLSDAGIRAIYQGAASQFGVNTKGVTAATWIRQTSRTLLGKMNAVLLAQGKEPIVERGAYITHLLEDTGKGLGGITPEIWAALKYGKQGGSVSRFLKQRLGAGDILEDPFRAHSAYVRAALKMIHLSPAKAEVLRKVNAKTVLRNGQKVGLELSYNTRKFIDDWLKHGVMEVTTDTDRLLNSTLTMSAKHAASRIKLLGYRGTIWGNPLSALRNTTQQTLNIARLGKYWAHGIASFNPKADFYQGLNGWQFADKYSKLLQGRAPALEGIDPTKLGALTQIGFAPFRAVDKANIVAGFNGAFRKNMAEGKSFSQAIKLADRLVRDTQFNYLNIDQPLYWLSTPGKLASQFQSWWTRYLEEVWSWGGTMPIGDGSGRIMRIAKHTFNVAKSREMFRYLTINSTLLYGLHKAGLPLKSLSIPIPGVSNGPMPTGIPPSLSGLLGIGEAAYGTLIGDKLIQQAGVYRVTRALPIHVVPGWTTLRKAAKISSGDRPPLSLFFPISEREFKKQQEQWFK